MLIYDTGYKYDIVQLPEDADLIEHDGPKALADFEPGWYWRDRRDGKVPPSGFAGPFGSKREAEINIHEEEPQY